MACPDKKKDVEMLQKISERVAEKTIEVPYTLTDLVWSGTLLDIQLFVTNLDDVLYITKVKDNEYIATIIERQK